MPSYAQNYTNPDVIIRGSRWPPAEDVVTVQITNTAGWPADADDWDWYLHISRSPRGDPSDLVLTAITVAILGNVLILTFFATDVQTLTLRHVAQGEPRMHYVSIRSTDPDDGDAASFYDCVSGFAWVRNYAGEGA